MKPQKISIISNEKSSDISRHNISDFNPQADILHSSVNSKGSQIKRDGSLFSSLKSPGGGDAFKTAIGEDNLSE